MKVLSVVLELMVVVKVLLLMCVLSMKLLLVSVVMWRKLWCERFLVI